MKLIKVIAVIAACGANCQLVYQDPTARIDDRVADLLNRMTIHEKTAQLIQGDMTNYLNITTGAFNQSGLSWNMANRAHAIWTGYYTNMSTVAKAARIGQEYLVRNTTHGESLHSLHFWSSNINRHSSICAKRGTTRVFGPQRNNLQFANWYGLFFPA